MGLGRLLMFFDPSVHSGMWCCWLSLLVVWAVFSGHLGFIFLMPVKTKLSLMLRACKSRIVSCMFLFLVVTEVSWVLIVLMGCCRNLIFSLSEWVYLFLIEITSLASSPLSLFSMEMSVLLTSVLQGGFWDVDGVGPRAENETSMESFWVWSGVGFVLFLCCFFVLFMMQILMKHPSM